MAGVPIQASTTDTGHVPSTSGIGGALGVQVGGIVFPQKSNTSTMLILAGAAVVVALIMRGRL